MFCRYGYGQLSLKFLAEAMHRVEDPSAPGHYFQFYIVYKSVITVSKKLLAYCCVFLVHELLVRREQHLNAVGVDLHSCLHFLLEHYAQLLEPQVRARQI